MDDSLLQKTIDATRQVIPGVQDPAEAWRTARTDPLSTFAVAGRTGPREARVLVRSPGDGPLHLEVERILPAGTSDEVQRRELHPTWDPDADHTVAFDLAQDADIQLAPDTTYRVDVRAGDAPVGRCTLHTAPAAGASVDRVAMAAVSCHNPFATDGTLHNHAERFLQRLPAALRERGVHRLLLMGDQVYTDFPAPLSLFERRVFEDVRPSDALDCSRDQVRALLHERYRAYWKVDSWMRLQASMSSLAVPDDHEIVDNYGSHHAHDDARWRTFAAGALDAFHDYQGARAFSGRPSSFDQRDTFGPVTTILLDLRSNRRTVDGQRHILSDDQLQRLQTWLAAAREQAVVVVGLSVPILSVPSWLIGVADRFTDEGGDLSDRWNHPAARQARDALLEILRDHQARCPDQRLLLVGGDVHVGGIGVLKWADTHLPDLLQLTTSPISNVQPPLEELLEQHVPDLQSFVDEDAVVRCAELLDPEAAGPHNPWGGLNAGLIEVDRLTTSSPRTRLSLLALRGDDIEAVTTTGWL